MDSIPQKRCTKCGEMKPATTEHFSKDKSKSSGLYSSCKACVAAYSNDFRKRTGRDKKRYWDNRESELIRNKEYRKSKQLEKPPRILKTKEEYAQYKHDWYIAHCDEAKLRSRRWYIDHLAEVRARTKVYRENNRDSIRAMKSADKARRRIRISEAGGTFTRADVELQIRSQKGLCWHCGSPVGKNYHIDHLTPIARGGTNKPNNIVISCPRCNCSRQDKFPHEWNGRLL